MLDNFENDRGWHAVNDNVMGGRSLGQVIVRDGRLQFEGSINTQGGGFASIRRTIEVGELLGAKAVSLRLRGDGRQYRLTLRDNKQVRGRSVSYQAGFSTSPKGQWQNVRIELKGLRASLFGQPMAVGEVDLGWVWSIGIIIADGQDGPFALQLDKLEFLFESAAISAMKAQDWLLRLRDIGLRVLSVWIPIACSTSFARPTNPQYPC